MNVKMESAQHKLIFAGLFVAILIVSLSSSVFGDYYGLCPGYVSEVPKEEGETCETLCEPILNNPNLNCD